MVKRRLAMLGLLSVYIALISCSTTPKGPARGTPAFYWQAARETWSTGDYSKTMEHLDHLLSTDNEYTVRALPWSVTLSAGFISGYVDLADSYERGARMNRQDPSSFRRLVSQYRTLAGKAALHFVEVWDRNAAKLTESNVALAFPIPKGSAPPVMALGKVGSGIVLPPAEVEDAQARALERGVLLTACKVAGAPNDTAKTEQVLRDGNGQVPKTAFLLTVAEMLYDQSQLYTNSRLDDPQKETVFCERAQAALKNVVESKESRALSTKVQATLKKNKRT